MTHKNSMRFEGDTSHRPARHMHRHTYADTNSPYHQENHQIQAGTNQHNISDRRHKPTIGSDKFTNLYDLNGVTDGVNLLLRDVKYADTSVYMPRDLQSLSRKLNTLLQLEGISPIIRDKIIPTWMNELHSSMLTLGVNSEHSQQRTLSTGAGDQCIGVVTQDVLHLPDRAPELYDDRPIDMETGKRETIIRFLERVWRDPWIANGILTRPDFRRLDPKGDIALQNWLRKPESKLPDHLHIPKKSEVIDEQLGSAEKMREAWRLAAAHRRRQSKPHP